MIKPIRILALLGLWGICAQSAPLPGYPFDPKAEKDKYKCVQAPITKLWKEQQSLLKKDLIYDVCVSKDFSPVAEKLIRRAFTRALHDMFFYATTFSCAKKIEAGTGDPAWEYFRRTYAAEPLGGMINKDGSLTKSYVYISALGATEDRDRFAEGYPHYYERGFDFSLPVREFTNYLSLALRSDLVGSTSLPYGNDSAFWAAMLSGAWLKNMGFTESLTEPKGTFLYEWMKCFLSTRGEKS